MNRQASRPISAQSQSIDFYLSAVEKFHSFREVHGLEWHANRHKVGQAFLDLFVRQVN